MQQRKALLEIREDKHGSTHVPSLLSVNVTSFPAVLQVRAAASRVAHGTGHMAFWVMACEMHMACTLGHDACMPALTATPQARPPRPMGQHAKHSPWQGAAAAARRGTWRWARAAHACRVLPHGW